MTTAPLQTLIAQANTARDQANWSLAINGYRQIEAALPQSPEIKHNLGLCYFAIGRTHETINCCLAALQLKPSLWQSAVLVAKSYQRTGQMQLAQHYFQGLLDGPGRSQALIGLADLALNVFGDPLGAIELVDSLKNDSEYQMDARLTFLMASLYDRPTWHDPASALLLSNQIRAYSSDYLRMPDIEFEPFADRSRLYQKKSYRPVVGIISPLLCVSPVYFLTISGIRRIARHCDVIMFSRGDKNDWATTQLKELASKWISVSHMPAEHLARQIRSEDLDVLYDLGGWMDAVALKALSTKPARKMFKWVGGQSVTTGLHVFDGWIGDYCQSPLRLQKLYSEPLVLIPNSFVHYVPPPYLPKALAAQKKSKTPCVFSNPAKVSRAMLSSLDQMNTDIVFIHRQFQYSSTQEKIRHILGERAHFVCPASHEEALQAVNAHATMIDTFPYSSGLTAREATALKTHVQVLHVGQLFCERHTAHLHVSK